MRSQILIIYIPGLNDHRFLNKLWAKFASKNWERYAEVFLFYPQWHTGHFKEKLDHLEKILIANKGKKIILIGQSAGGSAVINSYANSKVRIRYVINVCGRVLQGKHVFPSLSLAAKGNSAFEESVIQCEQKSLPLLSSNDKKNIYILRPLYDEVVPTSTCIIAEVKPQILPVVGHSIGGVIACLFYVPRILKIVANDFHSDSNHLQ